MFRMAQSLLTCAAHVFITFACACSSDTQALEAARALLAERRASLQALAVEIDREPGEMKRLIAEADLLRANDPAFDRQKLVGTVERAAPGVEVLRSEGNLWLRANTSIPVADTLARVASAVPHLTAGLLFVTDSKWGLDAVLPEVSLVGAYQSTDEPDEVVLPEPRFWQASSRELRLEIERLQAEVAALRKRVGALDGLPALRGRLARDHAKLTSGARLDRAALLISRLLGGKSPVFSSGSLVFEGDQARIVRAELVKAGSTAELLIAVAGAEEPGGDRGWNIDRVELIDPAHVEGHLGWRARR